MVKKRSIENQLDERFQHIQKVRSVGSDIIKEAHAVDNMLVLIDNKNADGSCSMRWIIVGNPNAAYGLAAKYCIGEEASHAQNQIIGE